MRLNNFSYNKYESYLLSDEWAELRRRQLKHQKRCQACGTEKNLHAHHMTYHRLGHEKLKDLKTLCGSCHRILHEKYNLYWQKRTCGSRKTSLYRFTRSFCKKAG